MSEQGEAQPASSKASRVLSKARQVYSTLSVEPVFALYIIATYISALAMKNLNLEKACRVNLRFNSTVCDALSARQTAGYEEEEGAVQEAVTSMGIWKDFLQSIFPALLIPFIGSWSDRAGRRKPVILIPIAGELLSNIGFIFCTYFFYELPMEVSGIAEVFFPSITGGWMALYMAVFSYLGDVTSLEDRTLRIGIINLCESIFTPVGTSVSGYLIKLIGYYGVFLTSSVILYLAITYGVKKMEEAPRVERPIPEKLPAQMSGSGVLRFLKDFFDLSHLKETLNVAFKNGANNRRKRVILLIVVLIVVSGPWRGELSVMYNFTRLRFNWNEVDYSFFLTFLMVINLIGTALTVGVLSHMLKVDDAIIGVISSMSKILAGFIYAFATATWLFYVAPLVDMANGTSYIAMRSIASKLVPSDELGKLNSVFGMAEAVVPVIYGPMYNAIYNETRASSPGAFFLIGGALTAPAVVIFLWLYGQHKEDAKRQAEEEKGVEKTREAQVNGETNQAYEADTKI